MATIILKGKRSHWERDGAIFPLGWDYRQDSQWLESAMHFQNQTTLTLMHSFQEKGSVPHRLSSLLVTVFCVVAKTCIGRLMHPTHLSVVSCHFVLRPLHHQHSEWQFPGKNLGTVTQSLSPPLPPNIHPAPSFLNLRFNNSDLVTLPAATSIGVLHVSATS